MDGRGFNNYNPSQFPAFLGGNAEYSQYSYPHRAIYSPGGATAKTQASLSQNSSASSSPELLELNGPSSSSSSVEERRVYARWIRLGREFWPVWKQESKGARKAWKDIAKTMNEKFGTKRSTDKWKQSKRLDICWTIFHTSCETQQTAADLTE